MQHPLAILESLHCEHVFVLSIRDINKWSIYRNIQLISEKLPISINYY